MEKSYIFVYGLFRDQAKSLLGNVKHFGKSSISGKIYKVNEFYPGFVRGIGNVYGDIYEFEESNLPLLDEYEGDEYNRNKIMTSSGIECWIYEYKHDISNFDLIRAGDWMLR